MANINKDGYIKTQDANGNIVTVYPYTKAGNVDGLDVFGASGSNHSTGLVPDPGATAGTSKYLREDGTWAEPAGGGGGGAVDTVYIGSTEYAPDANGKVTLPSYPTSLPASDVYSWAKASSKPSYTYSEVGAASSGHTHSNATTSSSGFMSYSDKSKLNGIDSGANYYTHPTGAGYKHIPSGGSSGQFLKYSSSGTAQWSSLSLSDVGGLKAIEYTFTLSQAPFSKSGSGLYYRSLDISSDFDTVIAATMSVWSGLQNYGFTPYISSPARVGIVLHAPGKTDASISFSSGYIKVMVLGY